MPNVNQFPQVIFVSVGGEANDEYLLAHLNNAEALSDDAEKRVAVYELKHVQNVSKSAPKIKIVRSKKTR